MGQPVRPLLLLLHDVNIAERKETIKRIIINFFIAIYLVKGILHPLLLQR
jgi:hypothetical protein